jgi:hypothetical protein
MYLWKCWRETRVRFIVTLILVAISTALTATLSWKFATGSTRPHAADRGRGFFSLPSRGADPLTVSTFWNNWTDNLLGTAIYVVAAAWVWGTSAVGDEFARNTQDFLLTRPRRRRHFIWVSWMLSAGQLLTAVFSYVAVIFLALVFLTKVLGTWKLLSLVLPLFLLGMVVLGVVFLVTTLSRGRRDGQSLALAVIILYPVLVALIRSYWKVHLPSPGDLFAPFLALSKGLTFQFPVLSLIGWSLVAVACPLLAQLYIERSEA